MPRKISQVYAYYEYLQTIRNKALAQIMGPAFGRMSAGQFSRAMMAEAERLSRDYKSGEISGGEAARLQRKFMDIQNLLTEVTQGSRSRNDSRRNSDFK